MDKRQLAPFLKWAGGKRQLLPEIRKYIPANINTYYEPFLGAGAVFFDIMPEQAVINDISTELINCYQVIRDDIEGLICELKKHQNDRDYFYQIRDLDRASAFNKLSPAKKAARIIFLNKTCFNGLFRVNSQGQFNVPFGKYKNPKIYDEQGLYAVHEYLKQSSLTILNTDFEDALKNAGKGDFVYLDPPYDPVSDTSSFTGYNSNGFGRQEQERLRTVFESLEQRGANVMLSNSATDFILDLYAGKKIVRVGAKRNINSNAARRGKIDEVLVMSYE